MTVEKSDAVGIDEVVARRKFIEVVAAKMPTTPDACKTLQAI